MSFVKRLFKILFRSTSVSYENQVDSVTLAAIMIIGLVDLGWLVEFIWAKVIAKRQSFFLQKARK